MQLNPVRTPMTPLLTGLILGLILARHSGISSVWLLSVAFCSCLTALWLSRTERYSKLWLPVFIISSTLCFWGYGTIRIGNTPSSDELSRPPREAQLIVSIESTMRFNERYNIANAIARVLSGSELSNIQAGDRIHLSLKIPNQIHASEAPSSVLKKGLHLQVTGVLTPIVSDTKHSTKNDFNIYLRRTGVYYTFNRISEFQVVNASSAFDQFCARMNQRFQSALRLGAPENSNLENIYLTMLLGDRQALTREQSERYRTTGTMHFFAISGLHIGVIATVIAQFLALIRIPRNFSPIIGLPLLYLYVEITGASPSAMRAFIMAAFFWSSFAVRRQRGAFPALVNSAVIVLIIAPEQLWNLGFQLSYVVVAGIILLGLPMHKLLREHLRPYKWLPEESKTLYHRFVSWLVHILSQLLAIGLSAWLASVPLCAAFFNFIAPSAIALNILLVYLVALVIVCGMLSIGLSSLLLHSASEFINHAAWLIISLMDQIVRAGTHLPNITFENATYLPTISYTVLLLYFSSLFWLHSRPGKMHSWYICIPVIVMLFGILAIYLHSCFG